MDGTLFKQAERLMLRRNIIVSHCKNYGDNRNIRGKSAQTPGLAQPARVEQFLVIMLRLRASVDRKSSALC
jgi:hypothetical protein